MGTTFAVEDKHVSYHVRENTQWMHYDRMVSKAIDATKIGGDPAVAQVFATLALAEAQCLAAFDGEVRIGGVLTVDS